MKEAAPYIELRQPVTYRVVLSNLGVELYNWQITNEMSVIQSRQAGA